MFDKNTMRTPNTGKAKTNKICNSDSLKLFVCVLFLSISVLAIREIPIALGQQQQKDSRIKVVTDAGRKKSYFQAGSPIAVQIVIKNEKKENLVYIESDIEKSFKFLVKDDNGNAIPLTRYGTSLTPRTKEIIVNISPRRISIPTGGEMKYRILLSRMFDMSMPGIYTIAVDRDVVVGNSNKATNISSVPTEIEVGGFDGSEPSSSDKDNSVKLELQ